MLEGPQNDGAEVQQECGEDKRRGCWGPVRIGGGGGQEGVGIQPIGIVVAASSC